MAFRTLFILSSVLAVHKSGAVPTVLSSYEDGYPIVHTNVGTIRGLRADDGDYSMFMGIPYAEVDPDNLFGNAKPYPYFENTFDAFDDSEICPQREEFNNTIVGSLDCLHLNIYVPDSASDTNRLPVYFYIFGGRFSIGFAGKYLYGPSFLVRHDIILVTLNYRLGPYGFMCLDIPEVPGNQGMKDQIMALKWVWDNIGAFGGDTSRITIGGNSAGGFATDLHLYYDQDETLFHKIIPQSGVIHMLGNPNPDAPFRLAELLNFNTTDVKEALNFLATIDPNELIAASEELSALTFLPCVEHKFEGVESFLTKHPLHLGVPRIKNIEVLIGFLDDEALMPASHVPDIIYRIVDFVQLMINTNFDFEGENELFAEMHEIVSHFYFGDESVTGEQREKVSDLISDLTIVHPIMRTVKKYLDYGVQTMYLYMFSYSGGRNFSKHRLNITEGGALHGDEIGYLFDVSYMEKPLDPEDQLIVDRMTEMWANFIKYGNPTPQQTELLPVLWQPVSRDTWHYLEIDSEIRVSSKPLHDRMAFLDLFYKANEVYQRGYNRGTEEPVDPEPEPQPEPDTGNNLYLDISLPVILVLTYSLQ